MSEELEKKRLFKVSGVGLDTTTIKFKQFIIIFIPQFLLTTTILLLTM